jgi:hypothetical protein
MHCINPAIQQHNGSGVAQFMDDCRQYCSQNPGHRQQEQQQG